MSVVRLDRNSERGVTLLEIANFVSLAMVIAALAMYGVARYVRHAKTAEAVGATHAIAQLAAEFFNASDGNQPAGTSQQSAKAMRHFPPASRATVPAEAADVRGKRYQSAISEWSTSPWSDLRFSMTQPQSYAYGFAAAGSGASATATATARGDLDDDGEPSTFSCSVTFDESLTAKAEPTVTKIEPDE